MNSDDKNGKDNENDHGNGEGGGERMRVSEWRWGWGWRMRWQWKWMTEMALTSMMVMISIYIMRATSKLKHSFSPKRMTLPISPIYILSVYLDDICAVKSTSLNKRCTYFPVMVVLIAELPETDALTHWGLMTHAFGSAFIQGMTSCQSGAKLFPESTLTYKALNDQL